MRAYTLELGGVGPHQEARGRRRPPFFSPDPEAVAAFEARVSEVKSAGDSCGGVVAIEALGVPPGLGEPVFDKLDARLAYALMGVGAVKAVEIGAGVESARLTGSTNNDQMTAEGFASNNAGGILGGISSGQPLVLRCAVKPIPSIAVTQQTLTVSGEEVGFSVPGRHDVAAIPRIVPVLKAMVLLVLADMWLLNEAPRPAGARRQPPEGRGAAPAPRKGDHPP